MGTFTEMTADLAEFYQDLHRNPELSFQEQRTAAKIVGRVEGLGLDVTTGVGKTGVVGVLRNGEGPTVLLRADFDALPVKEQTGLPYASTATGTDPDGNTVPVMHACGHDMHVSCLLGALQLLSEAKDTWSGTVMAVFQPAEEIAAGAQAMVDDKIFERCGRPDVALAQHVAPLPAGMVAHHEGTAMAATDALEVRMFGRGSHGSRPETSIDPVVMAAATVMRLQTVVSREIAGVDTAVVTIGALQAGTKDNVIPDEALLKINIRTIEPEVRTKVLAAVKRIINAEATASGAEKEPEISVIDTYPVVVSDPATTVKATTAIAAVLGADKVIEVGRGTGSEDFGIFGTAAGIPSAYWFFGGADPDLYAKAAKAGRVNEDIPSNHSAFFAPVIEPTLSSGIKAMHAAALAWLSP